jgi:hypothetical protein
MKVFVPGRLYKQLKDQAKREKVTITALVVELVRRGQIGRDQYQDPWCGRKPKGVKNE